MLVFTVETLVIHEQSLSVLVFTVETLVIHATLMIRIQPSTKTTFVFHIFAFIIYFHVNEPPPDQEEPFLKDFVA